MSVLKKSRRWLIGNLVIVAGMVALGALAPTTQATGGSTSLVGQCRANGPEGGPYTGCATIGLLCGMPGGYTGYCFPVNNGNGDECECK